MKLVLDADNFDNWQTYFIGEIMEEIKQHLEDAQLPATQVRDLTEKMAFSVACVLDGSRSVEVNGVELNPILTFSPEGEDLVHCGGNSYMHEYVFGISDEIFESKNS